MEIKRGQNIHEKHIAKFTDTLLILLLLIAAVMSGIQLGNMWYKLDVNIIEKVDADSFKHTINLSFPIIDTVYNSGKSSVSIAGEIKALFSKIFGFDLESPITILNIQSPVFMEYYNRVYRQKMISGEDDTGKDKYGNAVRMDENGAGTSKDTEKNGKQQTAEGLNDAGKGGGSGKDAEDTGDKGYADGSLTGEDSGKGRNTGDGAGNDKAGEDDGNIRQGGQQGTGADQAGKPGGSGDGTNNAQAQVNNGQSGSAGVPGKQEGAGGVGDNSPAGLQPISSIAYEVEEEDDEEKSDTVAADKIVIRNFTKYKIDIENCLASP